MYKERERVTKVVMDTSNRMHEIYILRERESVTVVASDTTNMSEREIGMHEMTNVVILQVSRCSKE